jgi:ribosome-associated translation inhibitor RaiA
MKRILVVGDGPSISPEARTYAEYRVFAALVRHRQSFDRVRVALRQRNGGGTCETVACAVSVALEPEGSVRVRVTGPHAYAAINRAVERLGDALGERVEQRRSD